MVKLITSVNTSNTDSILWFVFVKNSTSKLTALLLASHNGFPGKKNATDFNLSQEINVSVGDEDLAGSVNFYLELEGSQEQKLCLYGECDEDVIFSYKKISEI